MSTQHTSHQSSPFLSSHPHQQHSTPIISKRSSTKQQQILEPNPSPISPRASPEYSPLPALHRQISTCRLLASSTNWSSDWTRPYGCRSSAPAPRAPTPECPSTYTCSGQVRAEAHACTHSFASVRAPPRRAARVRTPAALAATPPPPCCTVAALTRRHSALRVSLRGAPARALPHARSHGLHTRRAATSIPPRVARSATTQRMRSPTPPAMACTASRAFLSRAPTLPPAPASQARGHTLPQVRPSPQTLAPIP